MFPVFYQKNMIFCFTFSFPSLFSFSFSISVPVSFFVCIPVNCSFSKTVASSSVIGDTHFISHVIDFPASFFGSLFLPNSCAMSCAKLGLVFAPNILDHGCILLLISNRFRYLQAAHAQMNMTMKALQTPIIVVSVDSSVNEIDYLYKSQFSKYR